MHGSANSSAASWAVLPSAWGAGDSRGEVVLIGLRFGCLCEPVGTESRRGVEGLRTDNERTKGIWGIGW